jgi:hypothetical protein
MNRFAYSCVAAMMLLMCEPPRAVAATTPYSGSPIPIPGPIPAANFDNGGEGVAYHDTGSTTNAGGQYRSTGVDIAASDEGGYTIGWIAAGEWLNYTVTNPVAGNYTATIRIAAPTAGGTLHIGFNGPSSVWKVVTLPATGGWQTFTNVDVPVTLGAGVQQMTLLFDTAGYNVSSVTVAAVGGGGSSGGTGGSTPYSGTAIALPGLVQASQFDNGGEGVAYHDAATSNAGGAFRSTGVDIESSSEGGYDVGWISAGEWLKYTVKVAAAGSYTVQLRVASPGGATMHVGFGTPSSVSTPVAVPATGGWQTWTTVSVTATLAAGTQIMTLSFDTAGFNIQSANVVTASGGGGTTPPPAPPPPSGGSTITVNSGGDFQAALDKAKPGDTIVLQAGALFTGNFVLPAKTSSATTYITITTSAAASALPGANVRISPSYAGQLPKVQSPNSLPAIATAPFAHHYRLQFLELRPNYQGLYDVLALGDGDQNTLGMVPHHLIVDHLYIHGDPTYGQKRGIALNSASTSITNSYISGIMNDGQDAQGICGWNGPGPFTITNNYIEGAGENVLFGGSDPSIPNLVPSDITMTRNYLTKPVAWRGSQWTVKNLLEFKNAQRVVVDGNIFENNWAAAQTGYSILFTPRNQDGTAPWTVVQDIQFTNNIVRHVSSAINILDADDANTSQHTNNITIRNNLFQDVSGATYGGDGRFVLITGTPEVTIDHNTVIADGATDLFAYGATSAFFTFTNNIMQDNGWAIIGSDAAPGNGTVSAFFPRSQFQDNVIAGAPASSYPTGNFYPSLLSSVGFVSLTGGNYRLSTGSPYRSSGTDGKDIGADINAINTAAGTTY